MVLTSENSEKPPFFWITLNLLGRLFFKEKEQGDPINLEDVFGLSAVTAMTKKFSGPQVIKVQRLYTPLLTRALQEAGWQSRQWTIYYPDLARQLTPIKK